jgi:hypothetical protein
MSPRQTQSGNILWLVLISIALLGALTAMFARSSGTSDDTGKYERDAIHATSLMRYGAGLDSAVQNLLARGCSENELSFWYIGDDTNGNGADDAGDVSHNSTSPGDYSCHIFHQNGAGITVPNFSDSLYADVSQKRHIIDANHCIQGIGTSSPCTSSAVELTLSIFPLTKSLCMAINNMVGADNPSDAPPTESSSPTAFTGTYGPGSITIIGDASHTAASLGGKKSGCYQDDNGYSANMYIFYYAIMAR